MSRKIINQINQFVDQKIIKEDIEQIMGDRFSRYSKYIIQERALPDVRDGLKPVQRRILYGMSQMNLFSNKPYKKSARIVGDVMGKYHPHGDNSIYEALVRMSQDFKMRQLLVDMHGNNGSIDGDSPAAMRYTEARLTKSSEYLLQDLDKKTVLFVPNFDDEETEPVVLPAKFPNLIVNGAMGISAGYATKIPPHNLTEIINATIHLLKTPNARLETLLKYVKGPDFPTGGIVQGIDQIKKALETGQGKIVLRGRVVLENISKTEDRLVILEIPYEVNKAELVRQIDQLRSDKILEDILEVRDESDKEGLRIAIDLKKGSDSNIILAYLYKNTNLQINFNYNMIAIVNNRPEQVGLLKILDAYINHYKEIITNRSNYLLNKAKLRQHIVLGLIKMVSIVDQIISIIRKSENKQDSKNNICKKFDFSEIQAEAIVTLQLYRLSNTDIVALEMENSKLRSDIKNLTEILNSDTKLNQVIEEELKETSKILHQDRKTIIEEEIENIKIDEKELISDENVVVGISYEGYVIRSSLRSYNSTKQSGLKQGDSFIFKEEISTLNTLLIFTNLGNYIYIPVYKLDEQKWGDLGIYINNIVEISKDEKIVDVILVKSFESPQMILLATKKGMMKQTRLSSFEVSRYSKKIRAMKLSKSDEIVSICINKLTNIVALSKNGYALKFLTSELPEQGLQASGVKGMLINDEDELVSCKYMDIKDDLLILTNRSHIMQDNVSSLPLYGRNRRGVMIIEKQKKLPHSAVFMLRYTKNQKQNDVDINIVFEKGSQILKTSELKSLNNKFGQKIEFEDIDLGSPLTFNIKQLNEDYKIDSNLLIIDDNKQTKPIKTPDIIQEKHFNDILSEVKKKTKKGEKVIVSKLDLFDDDY